MVYGHMYVRLYLVFHIAYYIDDGINIFGEGGGLFRTVRRVKGKAILVQIWTGPEGSRRLRLPYFKTIDT